MRRLRESLNWDPTVLLWDFLLAPADGGGILPPLAGVGAPRVSGPEAGGHG